VTPLADVATVLVSGARGAGKTTLLGALLDARPAGERQAVLLTEAGEARLAPRASLTIVEADPGCICCVGQVSLRVALTRLLREARPERLYVELAEPAHLAASLRTLTSPWLAPVLRIEAVIGVADASVTHRDEAFAAWLAPLTALRVRGDADGTLTALVRQRRPDLALVAC
jgi:G3E family GTPase